MEKHANPFITAIVLVAGLSTRMGSPKPLLPFGERMLIEHILATLSDCPVEEILVITGHARQSVEPVVARWPARAVFNPDYAAGEMLSSIQVGLQSATASATAALIVLGDQLTLERSVVEAIVTAYRAGQGSIVVPSYERRRGHPILIDRQHWQEILVLGQDQTLRDFMRSAGAAITHVDVTTPCVLRDMDTPDEYQRELADYLRRRQGELARSQKSS